MTRPPTSTHPDAETRRRGDAETVSPRVSASPRLRVAILIIVLSSALPFLSPLLSQQVFSFRDHSDYFIPLRYFTALNLRAGELPLWNPFNGSGERWLANPQTGVFYPPFWIFLLLPFSSAYVVYLWFHVLILGLGGLYLFSRWVSRSAAATSAVALMLCGPTLSLLDISNNLATLAWLPWVLGVGIARGRGEARFPRSVDGLLVAMLFLGGEPFLAAIGAALYGGILVAHRRFGSLALVAVLSILVVAVQLIPFLELLQQSDRVARGAQTLRQSMQPRDWLATLLPRSERLGLSQRYIPSVYLGLPIVFAAAVGSARARRSAPPRQRVMAWWLGLLLAVVLLAAGAWMTPIANLWTGLRLDVSRYPARLVPFGALSILALAAFGFEELVETTRRWRAWSIGILVAAVGLTLLVFSGTAGTWQFAVAAGWTVVLAVVLLVQPELLRRPLLLAPLLMADFLTSASLLVQTQPVDFNLEPYRSMVQRPYKVARLFSPNRTPQSLTDRRLWLSGYLNLTIRCFDLSTPAPVVSARYLALHDVALTEPRLDLVDFLSVGLLATNRDIRHPSYRPVGRSGEITLFRNAEVRPVAQVWSDFVIAPDDKEGLRMFRHRKNDARRNLYVSCRPGEKCALAQSSRRSPPRAATMEFTGLNEIRVHSRSEVPSILTLSQLDAPGWRVWIDEVRAQPLRANGMFRAVAVPAGAHQVRWLYQPRSLLIGTSLSTIALVAMMGEVFTFCCRRARGRA